LGKCLGRRELGEDVTYVLKIVSDYRRQLLLIYFYAFVVELFSLFEPYVLGKMIDGLISREYIWLLCFVFIVALQNVFIYRRMIYDTKVYTKIYNEIVLRYLKKNRDLPASVRIARTDMSRDIIDFLENEVHYYIYSVLSVIGTLCFIFAHDVMTGFVVISCVFPIFSIAYFLYGKINQCTHVGNDHYEKKSHVLTQNDDKGVESFFARRRKILIYGSTLQGKNWVSLSVTRSAFLIFALVVCTSNSDITQGQAVSLYAYISQFLSSLTSVPMGFGSFSRIKDVIMRIKE
jgi:ABC-type multidrug transport system fused ATPase/permease subunit